MGGIGLHLGFFLLSKPQSPMKCKLIILLLVTGLFSFPALKAESEVDPDTLIIRPGFSELALNSHIQYFTTDTELSADSAFKVFQLKAAPIQKLNKIHFGSINGFYWLSVTIRNTSLEKQDMYFQIRQPHLYRMIFHRVTKDSLSDYKTNISAVSEAGIRYNFYQRPSPHRYFDFPFSFKPGESYNILFMVHHINSLTLPIYLVSNDRLHQNYYKQNIVWGYWFGFLSFCALFALTALIVLRKSIFFWYFLYILSAALYGFTDQGYGFQYLFPRYENLDATVIVQLGVYIFIFLIKFSQGLLETKKYLPAIHRILNGIFYFLLILLIAGVTAQDIMFRISPFILPVVNIVVLTGLILLAISGIRSLFTNRIIAIYYLTAYVSLVCASIFSSLIYGFGLFQYNGPNLILIAYFFEAIVLSVALVVLFRQVQKERTSFMNQVSNQQKQMYQQHIEGIEKERSRIAGELHDDIGSKLSTIKQIIAFEKTDHKNVLKNLDNLLQDIRRLSHDLAPPVAHVSGLRPLVEDLIGDTRSISNINFRLHFYDYEEKFNATEIQQIYRIVQEVVHNITAHSKATHADIQFFGYENEMVLVVEDNGIGFIPTMVSKGIGLNQLKIRTESLGGNIEINSHPGMGTNLVFNIPLKKV